VTIGLTAGETEYEIRVGCGVLNGLGEVLSKAAGGKPYRPFVVTSPGIWELWGKTFLAGLGGIQPTVLFLPAGEKWKRMTAVEQLAEELAEAGADRDALLVAFGGGVIGDITGFLAAIYMRGVQYVQVPTTLLAQVDSSVGGKTGVNLKAGKNLVGSFNHPAGVVADIDLLGTLPAEELRAGLQESVKAGIIRDAALFEMLERERERVLAGDKDVLANVIAASIRVKADVVAADEKEAGLRMILNFGHTIGHAIEAATGYKTLLHGEAVGWGSIAALYVGLGRGTIGEDEFARMANLILAYGPLPRFKAKAERLVELTAADKKTRSGRRAYVLPTGIGTVEVVYNVTDAELVVATEKMLDDMKRLTKVAKA
jgi:3-dehydroquinate synthase